MTTHCLNGGRFTSRVFALFIVPGHPARVRAEDPLGGLQDLFAGRETERLGFAAPQLDIDFDFIVLIFFRGDVDVEADHSRSVYPGDRV